MMFVNSVSRSGGSTNSDDKKALADRSNRAPSVKKAAKDICN